MIALLLALSASAAEPVPLTGDAGSPYPLQAKQAVFGLFRPVTVGVGHHTDLSTSGLATLVAPRLEVRHQVLSGDVGAVAVTAGAGVPSLGLGLLRGTVLTTDPTQSVGFAAVASLGLVGGVRRERASLSLGVQLKAGVMTGHLDAPNLWWVDPMLAPLTQGPVARLRWVTDYRVARLTTLTVDTALQVGAGGPDASVRLFALQGVSEHVAVGAGWAIADETMDYGRDSLGFPLFDVQGRL